MLLDSKYYTIFGVKEHPLKNPKKTVASASFFKKLHLPTWLLAFVSAKEDRPHPIARYGISVIKSPISTPPG